MRKLLLAAILAGLLAPATNAHATYVCAGGTPGACASTGEPNCPGYSVGTFVALPGGLASQCVSIEPNNLQKLHYGSTVGATVPILGVVGVLAGGSVREYSDSFYAEPGNLVVLTPLGTVVLLDGVNLSKDSGAPSGFGAVLIADALDRCAGVVAGAVIDHLDPEPVASYSFC
ncbi:MAG: hypothetical protein ABR548_15480 [Actinomycetota bacterium]|nr:hypothetical protein [Actinomycetota bacterium]